MANQISSEISNSGSSRSICSSNLLNHIQNSYIFPSSNSFPLNDSRIKNIGAWFLWIHRKLVSHKVLNRKIFQVYIVGFFFLGKYWILAKIKVSKLS